MNHPEFLGLLLPCGQKIALSLPTTITLEVASFLAYVPLRALLPFFKYILKVVFYENRTACDFSLVTTFVSKWRPFNFDFNRGKREKYGNGD
jgi:hypothetical protein